MNEPPHQEPTDRDFMEAHIAALEADNTALRKRMEGLEEAISDFWVDRDIWDFDERGVPETWYPVGAIAEELAKALLDAHLSHAEKEA